MAGLLAFHFRNRAHLVQEVLREIDGGPAGPLFRRVQWFGEEALSLDEELEEYAQLRRRWGSAPDADRGEAASIVLARRNAWILVTDDGTGYHAARRVGVCVTRTPQLLVAIVRVGWMTADEAWSALQQMIAHGHRFGRLAWSEPEFRSLCSVASFDAC